MTMQPALQFTENDLIGHISSVDTSRAIINVYNSSLLTRICIGNLIAIKGRTEQEFLISIIERVTRSVSEDLSEEFDVNQDEIPITTSQSDVIRVVLIGTYQNVSGERKNVFKRGADSFPQIERECYIIESVNLQRFMGILGAGYPVEERLKLGIFVSGKDAEAIISGDKFFQRHAAILGSTGSGKSYTVALILERASKLKYSNIIVFDMHGEYAPLAKSEQNGFAVQMRIAGPGDLLNPSDDVLFLPYWLLNRDEMLSMMLDRSDQNAPNQASRFTQHVRSLKQKTLENEQKLKIAETFTVDSPIPYSMENLLELLKTDNTTKGQGKNGPVKGEWEDKLTRFISRMEAKLDDRRYGFMFSPPVIANNYNWLSTQIIKLLGSNNEKGIKIIDFSEVPSDVLPVVAGTLARLLYNVQFWMEPEKRTPVSLLCDEAHLYLPIRSDADAVQRQALGAFERIAKEGRKYGFSLLVISQRPSDVSKTILSQCNNFLSLRLTNDEDQNVIRKLIPDSLSGLTSILPLLDVGEALILGDAVLLPSRIKLDIPSLVPNSATRDFWREWATRAAVDNAIVNAVESLRSQTRSSSV